ncbi:hypothetical protein [Streptomyces sp. UH6]|uniref:hypothetical protein n=1 Tax=Streptomyces sp. UH6 TaxID=2748379 RepID=UPI0015D51F29|nr:hypothetical protein [Streptomyces sp. UH6]NYV73201.1 hypothetical protein [Streptomyces sp. UH6]
MTTLIHTQDPFGQSPDRPGRTVGAAPVAALVIIGIVAFLAVGTILILDGVSLRTIFLLLGGCGLIAVIVIALGVTVVNGRRRRRRLRAAFAALAALDSAPER